MTAKDPDGSSGASGVRGGLIGPLRRFLAVEASSGILLVVATIGALVWVNVFSAASYDRVWGWSADLSWAGPVGHLDLHEVINDALMAVFFFVVGLEIKLEWFQGSLRDRRFARLPIVAALGGMIVPAAIYLAFAGSTAGRHGWGIPMATDIAFVVGVMALLGQRVPQPIKVFLLTLAIVDDLGAIVVIAVFYASNFRPLWLVAAGVGIGVVVLLRRVGVNVVAVYALLALPIWYATWRSGVHATIAGVALAFATPIQVREPTRVWSPAGLLLERLHPWTGSVIVPLFALSNAGVMLGGEAGPDGLRVMAGVALGLVVGKCVGVAGASVAMVRVGAGSLPEGVSWRHLVGAGLLAGIGFTMSLFVTELAFAGGEADLLADAAKRAILIGSVVAAVLGAAAFAVLARREASRSVSGLRPWR